MSKMMTVRPPEKLKDTLKRLAKEKGYTLNHLVIQILWEWVNKKEKK